MKNKSVGFPKAYWDQNYSDPEEMDGIGNADAHIRYIKSIFDVEQINILSVGDLGFGLGFLLLKFCNIIKPQVVLGIEPSNFAFEQGKKRVSSKFKESKLFQTDLVTWCKQNKSNDLVLDIGLLTSVLQYLTDEEIKYIVPILAKKFRYLYLSVPTDKELKRQREEAEFTDIYAISRSKSYYYKSLRKNFTFISQRLLESKHFFNELNTPFTDLLFRF